MITENNSAACAGSRTEDLQRDKILPPGASLEECVQKVREVLKTLTSGEIYDNKGYLNEKGYKALEEIDGLDLYWICDPRIKLAEAVDAGPRTVPVRIERDGRSWDGYFDKSRRLLFPGWCAAEIAKELGYSWKEEGGDKHD